MRSVALSLLLLVCIASVVWARESVGPAAPSELRGIWMHATQVKTRLQADELIAKIDRANLNAVFLLVWYWGGQAFFRSDLCPMGDGVDVGHDPLGYMVEQCHARGIQVHAWFVNGAYGAGEPGRVLNEHPDWIVEDGAGGALWYDLGKPAVRKFQSDLMIECLRRYDADGIHFDYIRYGPRQCYCEHCQWEFASRYGGQRIMPERSRKFPIGVSIAANPVTRPTSATVLATFSDGTPAIAVNMLGRGMVLLLNWHAENEMPPAVAETVKVLLGLWILGERKVYIATTEETREEYGTDSLDAARVSLIRLGYPAQSIAEERIKALDPGSILVLPAVYVIGPKTAGALEQFVTKGGRLLLIDGPAKSMHLAAIQHVTGFSHAGPYIHRADVIQSTGRSPLVPKSQHHIDPLLWKYRMARWAEFRKQGVTDLVRDVYRRAKAVKPQAQVTAAVFSSLDSADSVYQDWPRWLREKTIDYVVPMAYTEDPKELTRQIAGWKSVDRRLQRIVPGLALYEQRNGKTVTRNLDLIRKQYDLCCRQGAHGNMYFSAQYLSDPVIALFRTEFYPDVAAAPTPSSRNSTNKGADVPISQPK